MVAEAVGRVVAPEVVLALAEFGLADGVFPVHAVLHRQPLDDTAAGPAYEGRFEVGDELGDVPAQAVGPVVEGLLREERHVVDLQCARRVETQGEPAVVHGLRGLHDGFEIFPLPVALERETFRGDDLVLRREDFSRHAALVAGCGLDVETQVVFFARFDGQSVETAVHQPERGCMAVDGQVHGLRCFDAQMVGVADADRVFAVGRTFDRPARMFVLDIPRNTPASQVFGRGVDRFMGRVNALVSGIVGTARRKIRLLEAAVEDQFGIDAAVGRAVDVFEEYAVHRRGDFGFFLRNVNVDARQGDFLRRRGRDKACGSQGKQC